MNNIIRPQNFLYYIFLLISGFILLSAISKYYIFGLKNLSFNIAIPLVLVTIEFVVVSMLLIAALRLNNKAVAAVDVLKSVALATSFFLLQYLFEFIWLLIFSRDYEPNYLRNFSSLSIYHIHHPANLPTYLIYPFQTINLWIIGYVLAIVYSLKKVVKEPVSGIGTIVTISYTIAIISWIVIATAINILNS